MIATIIIIVIAQIRLFPVLFSSFIAGSPMDMILLKHEALESKFSAIAIWLAKDGLQNESGPFRYDLSRKPGPYFLWEELIRL